jgi:hypothetical protein
MDINVSNLLREFPKVRRAALSGERVTVHTREGDLWITAAQQESVSSFGGMKGAMLQTVDDLERSVTQTEEWESGL